MITLAERLRDLPAPDPTARAAIHERAANLLRPSGALAWLDDIAEWVAGWQRTERPRIERPMGLIFAADHGDAAASEVSAYPSGVTEAMFGAHLEGRATISAFARIAGAGQGRLEGVESRVGIRFDRQVGQPHHRRVRTEIIPARQMEARR